MKYDKSIDDVLNDLEQLKKFCERKAISRWKEDVDMWTNYSHSLENAIKLIREEI